MHRPAADLAPDDDSRQRHGPAPASAAGFTHKHLFKSTFEYPAAQQTKARATYYFRSGHDMVHSRLQVAGFGADKPESAFKRPAAL